jgi:hypothetical protein
VYDPQFEWAYSSPESTVFTCTMLLPTLSEAQQLMDNVDLTEQQLTEFYEYMQDEWHHGAAVSYFARTINMGRLIRGVTQVELLEEERRLMCFMTKRSQLHKEFVKQPTNPANHDRVFEHTYNCLRAICELPSAPTLRPARPETTYPPAAVEK